MSDEVSQEGSVPTTVACARDLAQLLGIVDYLRRRSATADSSSGEFACLQVPPRDGLRCGELCVHLLDLRGLLFQFVVQVINLFLLRFHFAVRLQKFVKQHRVDRVVAHGINLAVLVRTTRSGFTAATSSAIRPNCGVFVLSLL